MRRLNRFKSLESQLFNFVERLKELNVTNRESILTDYYEYLGVNSNPVSGHFCSWEDIDDMNRDLISFGSHTHSHLILKDEGNKTILYELHKYKEIIENKLNMKCEWFCYPNARFNSDHHLLLKQAGYEYGVTLITRPLNKNDSNFYIPRFLVYDDLIKYLSYFKFRVLKIPYF
jgi:peptidoglycan/xylan/chitin deacetylase (PgdA/CDA1 family)